MLVCLLLLLVILLQQGKGGDMASAFGGGSSQTAFGARAGATLLTKMTTVCAVLFMLGALVLGDHRSARSGVGAERLDAAARSGFSAGHSGDRAGNDDPGAGSGHAAGRTGRRTEVGPAPAGPMIEPSVRGSGGTGRRTSLRGWR